MRHLQKLGLALLGASLFGTVIQAAPVVPEQRAPRKIAWGAARNGIRVGLTPPETSISEGQTEVNVTIWYENQSAEERKVLTFQGGNRCPLMFSLSEGDRQQRYIDFTTEDPVRTPLRYVTLKAGDQFHEDVALSFTPPGTGGFVALPVPQAKQPLMLAAGVCKHADTKGKASWDDAETLHSGPIRLTLSDVLVIRPHANDKPIRLRAGQTVELRLDSRDSDRQWHLPPSESADTAVTVRSQKHIRPKHVAESAAGTYAFTVQAQKPGKQTLEFQFRSVKTGFGKPVAQRLVVEIEVTE